VEMYLAYILYGPLDKKGVDCPEIMQPKCIMQNNFRRKANNRSTTSPVFFTSDKEKNNY